MAMRQGLGGFIPKDLSRQSLRSSYEDFLPTWELKEEQSAYVLHVHLPGFLREQLKITYDESTRVIKAGGERRLANSKWSRFSQIYNIPENCILSEIKAKFERGNLIITMPKKNIKQVVPKQEFQKTEEIAPKPDSQNVQNDTPTKVTSTSGPSLAPQKATTKIQDDTPSKVASSLGTRKVANKVQDEIPPKVTSTSGVAKPGDEKLETPLGTHKAANKVKDDVAPKVISTSGVEKPRDGKVSPPLGPKKTSTVQEDIPQKAAKKVQDVIPLKVTPTSGVEKPKDEKLAPSLGNQKGKEEMIQKAGNSSADSKKKTETKNTTIDEALDLQNLKSEQKGQKGTAETSQKATLTTETAKHMDEKSAKLDAKIAKQKEAKKKEIGGANGKISKKSYAKETPSMITSAKEAVNTFFNNLNEDEKQSLMNIGAAVIVIVALGTYISYNYVGSSGTKN